MDSKQKIFMNITEVILWEADDHTIKKSHLFKYKNYINSSKKKNLESYEDLWKWSVDESDDFWASLIDYFNVFHDGSYRNVTNGKEMPYTKWFEGFRLNYAEHILGVADDNQIAIIAKSEIHEDIVIRYGALRERVAAFQHYLRSVGIKEGDRVVAIYYKYSPCCGGVFGYLITWCHLVILFSRFWS